MSKSGALFNTDVNVLPDEPAFRSVFRELEYRTGKSRRKLVKEADMSYHVLSRIVNGWEDFLRLEIRKKILKYFRPYYQMGLITGEALDQLFEAARNAPSIGATEDETHQRDERWRLLDTEDLEFLEGRQLRQKQASPENTFLSALKRGIDGAAQLIGERKIVWMNIEMHQSLPLGTETDKSLIVPSHDFGDSITNSSFSPERTEAQTSEAVTMLFKLEKRPSDTKRSLCLVMMGTVTKEVGEQLAKAMRRKGGDIPPSPLYSS